MEMEQYNFDTLTRAKLLKLYKQKELKADNGSTMLDLQVAFRAFEEVPMWQATSQEDDVDDNEEEGTQTEDKKEEDPAQSLSYLASPSRPQQLTRMSWIARIE
ncbi:hypothetical protein NDU88_000683 [Pleurodeles waltl]|uniref:Uncharacterized protein n=1 Tax=Pleurodeles waltl TaxID=8319 RepID=A0AAV7P5N2_PLEWA|nr:hypothetical protein NDU88_000683 [Pleurodeles waltl]